MIGRTLPVNYMHLKTNAQNYKNMNFMEKKCDITCQ